MKNFPAKFKAVIATLLVAISFILPYYPDKMDAKAEPIEAGVQEAVITFENGTNRSVVCVPDEFKLETKTPEGWVEIDGAFVAAAFESLDSTMTDTITVNFGSPLAIGDYVMTFTFKTTNGWLTKNRTFTTEYAFSAAAE